MLSVIQAHIFRQESRVEVLRELEQHSTIKAMQKGSLRLSRIGNASNFTAVQDVPLEFVDQRSFHHMRSSSTTNPLQPLGKVRMEQRSINYGVQELMLHTIAQTAVTTFQPTSMEIFAQDGYTIDECGQLRTKTFVYAENRRYRINHHVSTFRTALGCTWLRTTTIHHGNESSKRHRKPHVIRSLILYPTRWQQYMGIQSGLEAVVASGGRSWLFNCNITVTRPVSDDSLIFELCRTGQTRAVEALLEKGMASVVDTSPKGWKPLHVRRYSFVEGHLYKITLTQPVCCRSRSRRTLRFAYQRRRRQVRTGIRRTF
jgi:hypothetical protein